LGNLGTQAFTEIPAAMHWRGQINKNPSCVFNSMANWYNVDTLGNLLK
jgi:hypothetical protein